MRPYSRRRRVVGAVAAAALAGVAPAGWIAVAAAGRVHDRDRTPAAPVAIVFGARVRHGKPMKFLQGRLDTAVELVADGTVADVLVSGDGHGRSGDEIAAMIEYLTAAGVDRSRIVADPYGLDTYDTCVRAATVFGVRRALLVTQPFHLPRAVALARAAGIDADGVRAGRAGGRRVTLARNVVREALAYPKAAWDVVSARSPEGAGPAHIR
ncbi:SanA/YdcF family protein [Rhodococcus sp. SGAir0479]|uniref:SanA/YdcF family protein n=1 Tax=Rhodococcus sp. SGAir0479 TaxID=2567884 RepID=UPI0010CCB310|nr:ElyC/SanA/YdcF family protein [Rhodococcus sp. SGAir0479]QCQ91522.1 YdcF family protein [Rhodococcus sp. SGAir0479]